MQGPVGTPYQGGVFVLYINSSCQYPYKPPEVRFLTRICHCNINHSDRIWHIVFDRDYCSTLKMSFILQCVYGLLLYHAPDDPLDSVLAAEFISTPHIYQTNGAHVLRNMPSNILYIKWNRWVRSKNIYLKSRKEEQSKIKII